MAGPSLNKKFLVTTTKQFLAFVTACFWAQTKNLKLYYFSISVSILFNLDEKSFLMRIWLTYVFTTTLIYYYCTHMCAENKWDKQYKNSVNYESKVSAVGVALCLQTQCRYICILCVVWLLNKYIVDRKKYVQMGYKNARKMT